MERFLRELSKPLQRPLHYCRGSEPIGYFADYGRASCYALVGPMARNLPALAKDDVTARLIGVFKNLISEGALTPGGRLPAERDLAEKFGVSRSSLRQALKVLQIMGVISQRVGA